MKNPPIMIVRHARPSDLDSLFELTQNVEVGMTSLPKDKAVLQRRLTQTADTLAGSLDKSLHRYLFVLEDISCRQIVGISAIEVMVGKKEPFYDFRVMTQVHSSKELNVYNSLDVLVMSNDYTGASELCSLYLLPDFRNGNNGKLISKARMLFMAAFADKFAPIVMAEMRGFFDDEGVSPFWTHFSSKFFQVDFDKVDYLIGTANKGFIAELMPRFPIYLNFVPQEAKDAIGKVHPNTTAALKLLEGEGLRFKNHIDIIDGGPKVEAAVKDLRAVEDSQIITIAIDDITATCHLAPIEGSVAYLLSNDKYQEFCALIVHIHPQDVNANCFVLPKTVADNLGVVKGSNLRLLALNPNKKP